MSNQQTRAVTLTREQFKQEITLARPQIEKMLPKYVTFEHFEGMLLSTVAASPRLLECSQPSLLRAVIQAADVGLSLNPVMREADILPVRSRNGMMAQFRPRAIGMMVLARRSGHVTKISAHEVYANDTFDVAYGTEEKITHIPVALGKEKGALVGAYCIWTLKDGSKQFEVLDRARIDKARAASEGYRYAMDNGRTDSVWHLHEGEMARKTAVRAASKYMPISTETDPFLKAIQYDTDDQNVVDGTFTETPEEAALPPSGATQVEALEAKLAGNGQPGEPSPSTAPSAGVSEASQSTTGNSTAHTARRTRKKAEKPAQEPQGMLPGTNGHGDQPPSVEPRPEIIIAGDDWDETPPAVKKDWQAEAKALKVQIEGDHTPMTWRAWLNQTKPIRDEMKAAAPDWWQRVMNLVERKEAWLRNNA